MADKTGIEWTDATWNPIRGCSMARGSELGGCLNCYAARVAVRYSGPGMPYEGLARSTDDNGPRWTGKVRTLFTRADTGGVIHVAGEPLLQPMRWKKPRRIFVNSMSDLFHETLAFEDIDLIVAVMALAVQHTFQVLTKRPARMAEYLSAPDRRERIAAATLKITGGQVRLNRAWPLPNVWWGVSAENQQTLDDRLEALMACRPHAAMLWLSAEPLLGPLWLPTTPGGLLLDWVVAGGESGPGARPAHPKWFRSLLAQCRAERVPFLFKQWGEWTPDNVHAGTKIQRTLPTHPNAVIDTQAILMYRAGKKAAGRLLDGQVWDQYPAATAAARGKM